MICLHRDRGDRVRVAFLTSGERGLAALPVSEARTIREAEAERAADVLGVDRIAFLRMPDLGLLRGVVEGARRLAPILKEQRPDVIYLPHARETHIDHAAALPIVRAALATAPGGGARPRLLGYEVWTPLERYDVVEEIGGVMVRKLRAIRCHASQIKAYRHDHAARGLALYRGIMTARGRYAEVFRELSPHALGEATRGVVAYWRDPSRLRGLRRLSARLRPRRDVANWREVTSDASEPQR